MQDLSTRGGTPTGHDFPSYSGGFHESSFELRRGLTVIEDLDIGQFFQISRTKPETGDQRQG